MTFAEDDHVIENLSSTGSYLPLGDRVLPGAAVCRADTPAPFAIGSLLALLRKCLLFQEPEWSRSL